MKQGMTGHHYKMLGLNLLISLVIMYFVMFSMIWNAGDLINNANMFYMALTMATPMGILMLLMMRMMYPNQKWNRMLYGIFTLLFILGLWGTRAQWLVGDRQFVRAMIPHHSGAILMCNRASLQDAAIRDLCFKPDGIVESQKREIEQMKAFLAGR
ncbi:MAG TPA: DUF305 domain-containing protein [Vicinamibacterales bacterium]|nr:DUF305 domain-containing protein [Vicinamibacterales bacterium]